MGIGVVCYGLRPLPIFKTKRASILIETAQMAIVARERGLCWSSCGCTAVLHASKSLKVVSFMGAGQAQKG